MGKLLRKKWQEKDYECWIFLLFLFGMAGYYGWRLFALTPWYDELYTYYYFISRGPVYAAIHWPVPNNHVGYSVLSACLTLFGNAAVSLRGVSWICSLISLCLLFAIGKKCFPKGLALIPVMLYPAMDLVNGLAVQGRGYALASCLYITAVYELIKVVMFHDRRKRNYVILSCAFIWSLYTLASSVYFVIPLCAAGGICLLLDKRYKEFGKLFATALASAVCTVGLYGIIWLAIGSNLLSKTPDSGCYGQRHVSIILHAPFRALRTGIGYMLDTPYIQSVARDGYLFRFGAWIRMLFGYYLADFAVALIVVVLAGILLIGWKLIRTSMPGGACFMEWYLLVSFVLTPLMLIVQSVLPYYRVFSYFGVPVALMTAWLCAQAVSYGKKGWLAYAFTGIVGVICIVTLLRPSYRIPYSDRERAIGDAYGHMDGAKDALVCVTDCDQEYLMKFLFDTQDVTYVPEEADYVLIDKILLLPEETYLQTDSVDFWKYYLSYEEIPRAYLEQEMEICYENERFVLYQK